MSSLLSFWVNSPSPCLSSSPCTCCASCSAWKPFQDHCQIRNQNSKVKENENGTCQERNQRQKVNSAPHFSHSQHHTSLPLSAPYPTPSITPLPILSTTYPIIRTTTSPTHSTPSPTHSIPTPSHSTLPHSLTPHPHPLAPHLGLHLGGWGWGHLPPPSSDLLPF